MLSSFASVCRTVKSTNNDKIKGNQQKSKTKQVANSSQKSVLCIVICLFLLLHPMRY